MALVVDASVALAWAIPDEISSYADAALVLVEAEGLHVPNLWAHEVANGLAIASRRKRITLADEQEFIDAVSRLTIEVEEPAALDVIRKSTAVARQYSLTAYDAAYLELAARKGLRLATLDGQMRDAAAKAGVSILKA